MQQFVFYFGGCVLECSKPLGYSETSPVRQIPGSLLGRLLLLVSITRTPEVFHFVLTRCNLYDGIHTVNQRDALRIQDAEVPLDYILMENEKMSTVLG
jgi:hypothetical protein